MWDLETIVRENNQAALEAMERGARVAQVQSPHPSSGWALSMLSDKLLCGPPLLGALIECFTQVKVHDAFIQLIERYLPGSEAEIMAQPRSRRVYRFCVLFSEKYYPLPEWSYRMGLSDFADNLPVELMGLAYSAYHDMDFRPGYLFLLSLVVYPFEGDDRDEEDDMVPFDPGNLPDTKYKPSASDINWLKNVVASLEVNGEWIAPMGFSVVKVANNKIELREALNTPEVKEVISRTLLIAKKAGIVAEFAKSGRTSQEKLSGARMPLLDAIQRIIGDLVTKIPQQGWHPADLHRMTDNTQYDGVGHFADWACAQTGCIVLDSSYEDCDYIEGYGEPYFHWSSYNVEKLTKEWPMVKEFREKIDRIVEWLEMDPFNNFTNLINFLDSCPKVKSRRGNIQYHDRMTPLRLEQLNDEDKYDEEE